jgi:hypothetical protein
MSDFRSIKDGTFNDVPKVDFKRVKMVSTGNFNVLKEAADVPSYAQDGMPHQQKKKRSGLGRD